jgi:hypothetical protein
MNSQWMVQNLDFNQQILPSSRVVCGLWSFTNPAIVLSNVMLAFILWLYVVILSESVQIIYCLCIISVL